MKNKNKKELIEELKEAQEKINTLEKQVGREKELEEKLEHYKFEVKERTKELNCIYGITDILETRESLDKIIQDIVEILPLSWQYPEITCARVIFEGQEFKTHNFEESQYCQRNDISVYGEKKGFLEVCYVEERPFMGEGPFLKAERALIIAISRLLGKIVQRKMAEEEIKKSHSKLRDLFERLQTIREEERKNIAREIHDELGQVLTALKIDISWLKKKLPEKQAHLQEKADSMAELVDMTIRNVKRIASELRPVLLEHFGLPAAILWQVKEFQKRSGIKCDISLNIKEGLLDRARATVVYRIVQELLTNIIRHAEATKVDMKLEKVGVNLIIQVKDNGIGIQEKQNFPVTSFGLNGIEERLHYWGGRIFIEGLPHKGTNIIIYFPLEGGHDDKNTDC